MCRDARPSEIYSVMEYRGSTETLHLGSPNETRVRFHSVRQEFGEILKHEKAGMAGRSPKA